ASRAVHDIHVAVAPGMDQNLALLAVELKVDEHVLVDLVVIEQIVRVELIGPFGVTRVGVTSEDRRAPEIVAAALVRVPGAWIGSTVVDQVEIGIVRDPAPNRAAPNLPAVGRPALHAEVLAF